MRNNGIFVILTLAFIITISAIGDDEATSSPSVDLAVEPITMPIERNISGAALRNDFPTFDALYKTARARGENVARWSELHRFWTWSMTDRVGGFYDQETHDRFARGYPGYAKFIADYRIIDSNGNVFYPSAETRKFLMRNVGEQPQGQIIARTVVPAPAPAPAPEPTRVTTSPRVVTPVPAVAKSLPVTPPFVAPVPAPVPAPVKVTSAPPRVVAPVAAAPATTRPGVGRGIFLIIVGLIGIGVVTVMLHAPGEEPRNPHPGIT